LFLLIQQSSSHRGIDSDSTNWIRPCYLSDTRTLQSGPDFDNR